MMTLLAESKKTDKYEESVYRKQLSCCISHCNGSKCHREFCFLWDKILEKPFIPSESFVNLIEGDVADEVLKSIDTSSYERKIFRDAIALNNAKVYKKMVMIKQMDPLEETHDGYNAVMMAAYLGDIGLFEWVLEKPGAKKLLEHKTYNGEGYIDFAKKARSGAFLNHLKDHGYLKNPKVVEKNTLEPKKT